MHNVLNENAGIFEFILSAFNENIADVGVRDFFLRNLNLTATSQLELSDCFTTFAYDKTDTIVWYGENLREW